MFSESRPSLFGQVADSSGDDRARQILSSTQYLDEHLGSQFPSFQQFIRVYTEIGVRFEQPFMVNQAILTQGTPGVALRNDGRSRSEFYLGGGFKYFLFSPRKLGKIPNLTNIFQRGGYHQPDIVWVRFFDIDLLITSASCLSLVPQTAPSEVHIWWCWCMELWKLKPMGW